MKEWNGKRYHSLNYFLRNKYGEKIVIPFNKITDNNPLENAINSSQYIAGNGLDISRHIKPMSLQKFK